MNPVLVSAAFGDRGDAGVLLEGGGIGESVALLAEGGQEARGEDGASAREVFEEVEVREPSTSLRDLRVERATPAEMARSCGSSVCTKRRDGSMTAGSEVSGRSETMASMRRSMRAARRTLWAWKKETTVSRGLAGHRARRASVRRTPRTPQSPCRETTQEPAESRP